MTLYIEPIKDYDVLHFAGGEVHIKMKTIINCEDVVVIKKKIFNAADIMELLLVNEVVRRSNPRYVELVMPYIPYARQDRATTTNSPRSLKVFADLINSCKFDAVTVIDPHSMVSENVINNMIQLDVTPYIKQFMQDVNLLPEGTIFISPDLGALKKVEHYGKALGIPVACFHKVRDPATGDITSTKLIVGNITDFVGKNLLVVDDICDGGGTFIQLANSFNHSNSSLHLFVTHGIFSKGLNPLTDAGFKEIGCTESFINWYNSIDEKLTVIPFKQ